MEFGQSCSVHTSLADFSRLEVAGCEGSITEAEIWEALKQVNRDTTSGIDIFPKRCTVIGPLMALMFNYRLKNGNIPQRYIKGVIKLLSKKKKMRMK